MRKIVEEYFHINNGGTTFMVVDNGFGPEIRISSGHFGTSTHEFSLKVSPDGLKQLAALFTKAAQHEEWSKTYCHTAEPESQRRKAPASITEGWSETVTPDLLVSKK